MILTYVILGPLIKSFCSASCLARRIVLGLFMKTKNISKVFIIFSMQQSALDFLEARDSKGVEFEEMYAVVGVESVEKSVEHSVTSQCTNRSS